MERNLLQVDPTIKPTWAIALRVWWSILWRGVLVGFLLNGIVIGIMGGIIGRIWANMVGGDSAMGIQLGSSWGSILGGPFGLLGGIWVIKVILGKEYKKFKVVVVGK